MGFVFSLRRPVRALISTFSVIAFFALPLSAEVPDVNGDGYTDIYYFNDGIVEIYDATSTLLASIPVPPGYRESGNALLFSGKWLSDEASVGSLTLSGPKGDRSGTLHILKTDGLVTSLDVGSFSKHDTVIAFDFDNSGLTDFAKIDTSGLATIHYDPGVQQGAMHQIGLPGSSTSFFAPLRLSDGSAYIAMFSAGSKRNKRSKRVRKSRMDLALLRSSDGGIAGSSSLKKIKGQPLPLPGGFLVPTKVKSSSIKFSVIDSNGKRVANFNSPKDRNLVPGTFTDGSALQVISSQFNSGSILDLADRAKTIGVVELSAPINGGNSGSGSSGGNIPNGPVTDAYIQSLLDELRRAIQAFDFSRANAVIETITQLNLTKEQADWVTDEVQKIMTFQVSQSTRSSTSSGSIVSYPLLVLEQGVPVSTDAGGLTKDKLGCEVYRNPYDGDQGFLSKESDHGGYVALLPAGLYTDKNGKMLNPKTGKTITVLANSGVANGGRVHLRAPKDPTGYPKHVVISADIGYFGTYTTYCWEIKDLWGRVD